MHKNLCRNFRIILCLAIGEFKVIRSAPRGQNYTFDTSFEWFRVEPNKLLNWVKIPLIISSYLFWRQYIFQSFPKLGRLIFGHLFSIGFKRGKLVLFENSEQAILQRNALKDHVLKSPSSSKYPVKFPSSAKYSFWKTSLKFAICSEHRLKTSSKISKDFLRTIGNLSSFWKRNRWMWQEYNPH